ncbi:MAG: hypothetical protein NTZ60_05765 [Campylobacterales bacterium]|nr:hypothetical protein [Campylobacterales bacterium]
MNTSYGVNAYTSHDLNISMKTSSGDVIKMDFANKQELSMSSEKNKNGTKESLSFSSMQSFQFSMTGNGIDEQDQKEIDAFMKTAKPFIDSFLKELEQDAPKTPVTKLANQIADIFAPMKEKDENTKNHAKSGIVKSFDNSMKQSDSMEKIFEDVKKLLEKTLQSFDELNKKLYA